MFHTIGVVMILIAVLATLTSALMTALQLRRLVKAVAGLRRHPMFDVEWRARQAEKVQRLQTGATRLKEDFARLGPALAALAVALQEMGALVSGPSDPIDRILRASLPWLAGLLRPKSKLG